MKNTKRMFYRSSKAWYAESLHADEIEIMFGIFDDDGRCVGEMAMRWHDLGGKLFPRLECFDDAWMVLATFHDLIEELGKLDSENITESDFADLLLRLGFEDGTSYINPNKQHKQPLVCSKCGQTVKE